MHPSSHLMARLSSRRMFAQILLVLVLVCSHARAQIAGSSDDRVLLQGVNVLSLSKSSQLFLSVQRPVQYSIRRISRPPQIIIELQNATLASGVLPETRVEDDFLRSIAVEQREAGIVRVTVDLNPLHPSHHSVLSEPPAMLIEFTDSDLRAEPETAASLPPPPRSAAPELTAPARQPSGQITGYSNIYRVDVEDFADRTRVFVGLQRVVEFRRGRLNEPERLYFDFPGLKISPSVATQIEVASSRLKGIRLGQFQPTVARVVLDLEDDCVDQIETQASPPGLIIDLFKPEEPKPLALTPVPEKVVEESASSSGAIVRPPVVPPVTPKPDALPPAEADVPGRPLAPVPPTPPVPNATREATAQVAPLAPKIQPETAPLPTQKISTPTDPNGRQPLVLASPASVTIPFVKRPPKLEDFLQNQPREAEATVTGFRQRSPQDGAPASEETKAYLSYDDHNVYVVFDCKDDPEQVRSQMNKREQISRDDQVTVYLDTYRDGRRAFIFATNPLGIQKDGVLTEGQGSDFKFDTLWDSEGRLTDDGFMVWIKIPFRSLRFNRSQDQTWGIALGRSIRRKEEFAYWPYITRKVEGFVQQMGELRGLSDISPGRNFEAIPYATYTDSRFLGSTDDGLGYVHDEEFQSGVDAKAVFRDSLTLDLTVNPDFSQVESDEPQVTINRRFEVFFPEKRPFFLENADFFETPERLFFSRRIADPQFGARLTGKVGDWRMGILAIDDEAPGRRLAEDDVDFGKRAGNAVIRMQRDFGDQSNVGLLVTSRDFANTYNRVFGIDTRIKLNDNWFFTGQASGSETREANGRKLSDPAYMTELTHSGTHANFSARYLDRSPEFRSQLGYIPRVDIRQADTYYQYLWYPSGGKVISFGPAVSGLANWDREGRLQDWYLNANFRLDLLGPTNLEVNRYESFTLYQDLEFRYGRTDFSFFTGFLNWIEFFVSYGSGSDINYNPAPGLQPFLADAQDASFFVGLRPFSQLSLDGTYIFSSLRTRHEIPPLSGPQAVTIFNNHLFRWRGNYQYNRELSFRAIVDFNTVIPNSDLVYLDRDKYLIYDLLITYLLNPGTALYAGYTNRLWNIELDPTDPYGYRRTGLPSTSTSRQFFVKISRLFRF